MDTETKLHRYGLTWNGERKPVPTLMDDGYWTPWHVAEAAVETVRETNRSLSDDLLKAQRTILDVHDALHPACGEGHDLVSEVKELRAEITRLRHRLAAAEADRDKAEENERVLADILLSESVPTEDVHREIKARVDSGKIPPFIVCGWCGAPGGTMEAYKEHAVTCSANPAVQRAAAAEAERDAANAERIQTRDRCFELVKERDEARTTINLVREVVEEMRVDATRPKGGQSVGMRRMPVALSVILELQGLLGPEQAAYTNKMWVEEREAREAAETRAREAEAGWKVATEEAAELQEAVIDVTKERAEYRDRLFAARAARDVAEGALSALLLAWDRHAAHHPPGTPPPVSCASASCSDAITIARRALSSSPGEGR